MTFSGYIADISYFLSYGIHWELKCKDLILYCIVRISLSHPPSGHGILLLSGLRVHYSSFSSSCRSEQLLTLWPSFQDISMELAGHIGHGPNSSYFCVVTFTAPRLQQDFITRSDDKTGFIVCGK